MKICLITCICLICFSVSGQTPTINSELKYLVNLPTKKTEKPPVIILLHGYGANESDLFDITKSFDGRFLSFSVQAPTCEGSGCRWYDIEWQNDSVKNHNYAQLKVSEKKLFQFISSACKAYKADSSKVIIIGFSQGAIMAYDMLLTKPDKIKAIMALSGRLLPESKTIKLGKTKAEEGMCFIAHGYSDNVIKPKHADDAASYMGTQKFRVEKKMYEMPHSICGDELNDMKRFLIKVLDPPPTEKPKPTKK
jgi:phospholipase/carboxylesterase